MFFPPGFSFEIATTPDSCKSRSEPARARPGLKSRAFGVRAAKCRAGPDEARPGRARAGSDRLLHESGRHQKSEFWRDYEVIVNPILD